METDPHTQMQFDYEHEGNENSDIVGHDGDESLKPSAINKWMPPSSDEDDGQTRQFNVEEAWMEIFHLKSCQQIIIEVPIQKKLQNAVGENVSHEFPWKQIKYKFVRDILFDDLPDGETFAKVFSGFDPENYVLIGYAPLLTQNMEEIPEGDPFVFFFDPEDAKKALAIVRNIEAYERWMMNKRLVKKPKRWVSLGSENEVNLTLQQRFIGTVDVEIQSVYPLTIPADKTFTLRKSTDVRDGYVELLPSESVKFDNIVRRRVTVGIQSAPELVDLGQQTDPTFPTNAWTQYLYEVKEGAEGLDESSEDEATKEDKEKAQTSKAPTPIPDEVPKAPPEMSEHIKFLLRSLEFNQIDMYRDDYPDISQRQVQHFSNPFLEETLCFANIAKSHERYVCGNDWYPSLSGLLVTSYTFDTPATVDAVDRNVDTVQRAVLQANPVLMWSFADNLNYKLVFDAPIETTALSFCPHDPNLLFGGCKNGQLIIWDLQNRAEKLDYEELLTSSQANYRFAIGEFLKSTIETNEEIIVPPVLITALEVSPKAAITNIYWLSRRFYINTFGKAYTDPDKKARHKCFATCSIDGLITFWDLDAITEKKVQGGAGARRVPKALAQNVSQYKNKIMKPMFMVGFNEPITAIFADTSVFGCRPYPSADVRSFNYRTELVVNDPPEMRQTLIVSTFYGRIERLNWLGLYTDTDSCERVNISTSFARIHDGPIISMKKNPFCPNIFVTIGKNVFAVWKEDYNYTAIFWRKRLCDLTAVSWSEDRPSVLFLTRIDGNLEAWDILARDGDACLDDVLGGGIITSISEHRPSKPEKLLGIGDYNSSFRMVKLPQTFYVPMRDELILFNEYINKEENRKKNIQAWEQQYYELNKDVIEAKRQAEVETRKEMERIEKENALLEARKAKEEAEKFAVPLVRISYTERMKREWDELNLNRLLSILMTRKRVDAEQLKRDTVLEKRRLAYEAAKKDSLAQTLQRVGEEVANIRARILPAEKHDRQRAEMINAFVETIMSKSPDYDDVEQSADNTILRIAPFKQIDYIEYLERGEKRREQLNASLGGNTERLEWYTNVQQANMLDECNWGYERFVSANADLLAQMAMEEEASRNVSQDEPTDDIEDYDN